MRAVANQTVSNMRKSATLSLVFLVSTSLAALADDFPIKLVSITAPVHPGGVVTLVIQTQPGAICEGNRQGHFGNEFSIKLPSQTTGADGLAQWQWSVRNGNRPIGLRGVHVTCTGGEHNGSLDTTFNVQ